MRAAAVVLIAGAAATASAATTHTVVPGDHLWGLAGHYYGNHFRWKVIYAANKDKIKEPDLIYPGQVFVIPEVPGPEIGELPARPVETEAAAEAPDASAEEPPSQAAEPAASQAPAAVEGGTDRTDDLSVNMPEGFAGQYPSLVRLKVTADWHEDGTITEFEGREVIAAAGDWVQGKLSVGASVGDSFGVYRPSAPQELDGDKAYWQRVGLVQVKSVLGKGRYRFLIVKSGDSVQVGDLLKKEESR